MKSFTVLTAVLALAACEPLPPLSEYRPVVDTARVNAAKFDKDLGECRAIATQVEADYKKRQQDEMAANMVAGLIVGALVGAAVGGNSSYQHDMIAYGAASGAASGAAAGDYTYDLVTYGPRRVVDRCMTERGYNVLNDPGKG